MVGLHYRPRMLKSCGFGAPRRKPKPVQSYRSGACFEIYILYYVRLSLHNLDTLGLQDRQVLREADKVVQRCVVAQLGLEGASAGHFHLDI